MAGQLDEQGQVQRGNWLRLAIWGFAGSLFLLPLVAMQFTSEMDWDGFDFLVWGLMLLVACGTYELVSRMSPNRSYRLGVAAAIATGFLVFWANGAVGMIGSEDNPYNVLFLGTILVGALLALVAWFKPRGMARALYVTSGLHAAMALYALVSGMDMRGSILALCFALPYLFSAGLFSLSAKQAAIETP